MWDIGGKVSDTANICSQRRKAAFVTGTRGSQYSSKCPLLHLYYLLSPSFVALIAPFAGAESEQSSLSRNEQLAFYFIHLLASDRLLPRPFLSHSALRGTQSFCFPSPRREVYAIKTAHRRARCSVRRSQTLSGGTPGSKLAAAKSQPRAPSSSALKLLSPTSQSPSDPSRGGPLNYGEG